MLLLPRLVRSHEKVLQNLLRKRSRPDPTCDDDPWSTLVENLWSSGVQVSYTIAPAMHTALFTLIRSRRVCELTCTCGHLGRLGRHECERHIDLPKRDSWMYRHISSPSMPAACPMVNGINCRGRCAMRKPSPHHHRVSYVPSRIDGHAARPLAGKCGR